MNMFHQNGCPVVCLGDLFCILSVATALWDMAFSLPFEFPLCIFSLPEIAGMCKATSELCTGPWDLAGWEQHRAPAPQGVSARTTPTFATFISWPHPGHTPCPLLVGPSATWPGLSFSQGRLAVGGFTRGCGAACQGLDVGQGKREGFVEQNTIFVAL